MFTHPKPLMLCGVASFCLATAPAPAAETTAAKPAPAKPAPAATTKATTAPTTAKPARTSTPVESLGRYLAADVLEAAHGLMDEWKAEKTNYLKNRPDKDDAWVSTTEAHLQQKKGELLAISEKLRKEGLTAPDLQSLSTSAEEAMQDVMDTLLVVRVRAIPKGELAQFCRGFDEMSPKLATRWSEVVASYRKTGSDSKWMDMVEAEAKQNLQVVDASRKSADALLKAGNDKDARVELEKTAISVMWLRAR